jgi:hypothetical protein
MNDPSEVNRHGWWSPTTRTEAKKKLEKVRGSPPSSTKEQMVNTQPPGLTRAQAMQKVLDLLEVPEAEVGQAPQVTLAISEAMKRTVCSSLVTQLMDTAAALTREMDVEARREKIPATAAKTAADIEMCETAEEAEQLQGVLTDIRKQIPPPRPSPTSSAELESDREDLLRQIRELKRRPVEARAEPAASASSLAPEQPEEVDMAGKKKGKVELDARSLKDIEAGHPRWLVIKKQMSRERAAEQRRKQSKGLVIEFEELDRHRHDRYDRDAAEEDLLIIGGQVEDI